LIAHGVDVATISDVVGHADAEVTHRIYSHALKQPVRATADRIDELFGQR
jgi:integrase